MKKKKSKPGPKHGRLECVIDLPPADAPELAAWRRRLAFAIVGQMGGAVPGRAYRIWLRAGIPNEPRSLLAVAAEIVDTVIAAGVVPNGESITDLTFAWDRIVPTNSVFVRIASTSPPKSRATLETRRVVGARGRAQLIRGAMEAHL